jgi:hypothetical protein
VGCVPTFDSAQTSVLRSLGPKSVRSTLALLARSVTASITPPARPHSAATSTLPTGLREMASLKALTLHAALAPIGVYAGTLTIGDLIERGDIHLSLLEHPDLFGNVSVSTLNPDELADLAWRLYRDRTEPEAVVNTLAA